MTTHSEPMTPTSLRIRLLLPLLFVPSLYPGTVLAAGVSVGASGLIADLHYSDTFTPESLGGVTGRDGVGGYPPPDIAMAVEGTYGNPARAWTNLGWSFNVDSNALNGGTIYPGGSGAGSATGMTQTGGFFDRGIEYGLSNNFVIQVDATQPDDRMDVFISPTRDSFFVSNALAVFFRSNNATLPDVGIYSPSVGELITPLSTDGIIGDVNSWNNYAVEFDLPNRELQVYVNEVWLGTVDLDATYDHLGGGTGTFAGIDFSNATVNFGGAGANDRFWTDNFQVGSPIPEPGAAMLVLTGAGFLTGLSRRRGRA